MKSEPWYINPQITPQSKEVIIIGGGLAGTSAAESFARRGWSVKLIERGSKLAAEASGNPAAILSPLITHKKDPIGEFYLRGFEYILGYIKKLNSITQQVNFQRAGILELTIAKINKDISDTIIPANDIIKTTAEESSSLCGLEIGSNAIYIEKGGFLNPAELCQANINSGGKNIEIILSQNILSLVKNKDIWTVFGEECIEIASAPIVVIANAADASVFSQCNWLPINKVRGQLTYLPANSLKLKKILCYDGGYITPEINGYHYVGATYSRDNLNSEINLSEHKTNIDSLKKVINIGEVDYNLLQGRVSFRASVIDRRPVIGAVPDIAAFYADYADLKHGRQFKEYPPGKYLEGLYISTGYGSRGLVSCPIGGELIAAMVSGEKLPLPQDIINILNPARFIIKNLKCGF